MALAGISGCLSDRDIEQLNLHAIPYHRKPLLYGKVIDELRRMYASSAPEHVEPEPEFEPKLELPADEPAVEQKRKGFKFWPFK